MESVNIKTEQEGDLADLDFRARISLAMLLDPSNDGADWRYANAQTNREVNSCL